LGHCGHGLVCPHHQAVVRRLTVIPAPPPPLRPLSPDPNPHPHFDSLSHPHQSIIPHPHPKHRRTARALAHAPTLPAPTHKEDGDDGGGSRREEGELELAPLVYWGSPTGDDVESPVADPGAAADPRQSAAPGSEAMGREAGVGPVGSEGEEVDESDDDDAAPLVH
jgi:hypothetical protein